MYNGRKFIVGGIFIMQGGGILYEKIGKSNTLQYVTVKVKMLCEGKLFMSIGFKASW